MSCMLKLGDLDCLVRGAPGESRSLASLPRPSLSSWRLMVENLLALMTARLEAPSKVWLPFTRSKDLVEEVLAVRTRPTAPALGTATPLAARRCFFTGVNSMVSAAQRAAGSLRLPSAWSLPNNPPGPFFRLLLLDPVGWLLLDAPDENPSSASVMWTGSSPPLAAFRSVEQQIIRHQVRHTDHSHSCLHYPKLKNLVFCPQTHKTTCIYNVFMKEKKKTAAPHKK